MTNWNSPQTSDTHSNELAATKGRDESNATMDYSADSNIPDGTIRWNISQNRFESWDASGGTWSVLSTEYSITVSNAVDSDLLDGFDSGNSSGQIPISNGTVNSNFNADRLDGEEGSFYQDASNLNSGSIPDARVTESNVTQHGPAAVQTRFVNVDGNVTSTDEELNVLDGISGRTGSDVNLVSGTAGTDGNLVQWNADGDAVDGPDVLDEDDMASDSASAVPTQQSAKAYVDGFNGAGLVPLAEHTPSSVSSVTDTSSIDGTYRRYRIELHKVLPATDDDTLLLLLGDSGGGVVTGSEYQWGQWTVNSAGATSTNNNNTGSAITLSGPGSVGNSNDIGGVSGSIELDYRSGSSDRVPVFYDLQYFTGDGNVARAVGAGAVRSGTMSSSVDRFRLEYNSGNIASGVIEVYGVRNP